MSPEGQFGVSPDTGRRSAARAFRQGDVRGLLDRLHEQVGLRFDPPRTTVAAARLPCLRQSSATVAPASLSRSTPMICSSLNLLRFISGPLSCGPDSSSPGRRNKGSRHVAPSPVWTPLNPSDKEALKGGEVWCTGEDGAPGTAGGDRPGLRVSRLTAMLQLHQRRAPAVYGGYWKRREPTLEMLASNKAHRPFAQDGRCSGRPT